MAEDVDPITGALAEAFRRDDLAIWIFPDPLARDAALAAMFRSRMSDALQNDGMVVDVADDLSGAAIWQSPHVRLDDDPPPGARPDVIDAFRTIFAARPQPPYWYLDGIGARTERRGIGSALIAAGLRRLDTAGVPSALMTGAERNLAFYRKHGYRELQRFDFPGASAWWMWRDPVS
jgi:ribosomal protein S18 acetylase RimI-like enzyme